MNEPIPPTQLLSSSKGKLINIQLKSGDTINGTLLNIDAFLNVKIKDAVYSNKAKSTLKTLPEIYIRGNNICSFKLENDLIEQVKTKAIEDFMSEQPKNDIKLTGKKRYKDSTKPYKQNFKTYKKT